MGLHVLPSCNWRLFFCFASELDLFPPKVGILIKLEGCHGHHLLIAIVVHAEDLVDLNFPREIFIGLIGTGEHWHGELELAESFFSIAVPVAAVTMIWAVIIIRALMSCLVIVALLLRLLRCRVWWWSLVLTTSLGSLLILLTRLRTRRRLMVLTTSLGSLLLFLSWLMPRSIVLRPVARRTSSRMRNGLLFFFLV